MLMPVTTDQEIAPAIIKSVVRCKCKINSKNPSSTILCTCKKYGMPFLSSCIGCLGQYCYNSEVVKSEDVQYLG